MTNIIIAGQSMVPETAAADLVDYSNLTVKERALIWGQQLNQNRRTTFAMLASCQTFPELSQLLVETLQTQELKEHRESYRNTVNQALVRVRESVAAIVLKYRANPDEFPTCNSEQDVVRQYSGLSWFTDTITLKWNVASLSKLEVKAGTHSKGSCIPALPAPAESVTVTESKPAAPANPADDWVGEPRERIIRRAVQYRKQAYELQGIVAQQGETIKAKDDEIRDLLARIKELETKPKGKGKTGTDG